MVQLPTISVDYKVTELVVCLAAVLRNGLLACFDKTSAPSNGESGFVTD